MHSYFRPVKPVRAALVLWLGLQQYVYVRAWPGFFFLLSNHANFNHLLIYHYCNFPLSLHAGWCVCYIRLSWLQPAAAAAASQPASKTTAAIPTKLVLRVLDGPRRS